MHTHICMYIYMYMYMHVLIHVLYINVCGAQQCRFIPTRNSSKKLKGHSHNTVGWLPGSLLALSLLSQCYSSEQQQRTVHGHSDLRPQTPWWVPAFQDSNMVQTHTYTARIQSWNAWCSTYMYIYIPLLVPLQQPRSFYCTAAVTVVINL